MSQRQVSPVCGKRRMLIIGVALLVIVCAAGKQSAGAKPQEHVIPIRDFK